MVKKHHKVKLIGLNERCKKILSKYNNEMFILEYDNFGKPLCIAPNGEPGIFCISLDGIWNGWFILDKDVRFYKEYMNLIDLLKEK
jgi:hypothetical protein